MSRGQLKVIFLTLGVLLIVYAGVRLMGGNERRSGPRGHDIGDSVEADVGQIRISGGKTDVPLELLLTRDGWTVNGYPADEAQILDLIAGLDTARTSRLVARSPSNHASLGVAEEAARLIEIGPGADPVMSFYLGTRGAGGRYVRFVGENETYFVPGEVMDMLDRGLSDWRDRNLAAVDTATVTRIRVWRRDEGRETALTRPSGGPAASGWSEEGIDADLATVQALLESVVDLQADGFPSDSVAFAADFANPAAVLELYVMEGMADAPELSLLFLTAPDAPDFLVRRADNPLAYRLSADRVAALLPARAQLFPDD